MLTAAQYTHYRRRATAGRSSPRSTLPRLSNKRRNVRSMVAARRSVACESDTPASAGASTTGSTASIVGVLGSSEHANGEQQQPPTGSLSPVDKRASCRNARSHDDDNAMSISLTKDTPPGTSGSGATSSSNQTSSTAAPSTPMPFRCFPASKAKRVRFFRNGDQYFKGMWYAISAERVRSFQALLCDLTRTMSDASNLPHGVRHVFSMDGSQKISSLDDFQDGEGYVCSSSETYKRVDYENAREPTWCISLNGGPSSPRIVSSPLKQEPNDFVYPRIITIIRNGVKPRRVVRHLLNKRTARSFLQVIQDITAVVKLDSGAVRKLFALSGKEVTCLADFFGEDDVFIAYGKERMGADDFYVVSEECKRLYSSRARARRGKPPRRRMPARNESLREDRAGSVVPDSEMSRQLPLPLDDKMHIVRLIGDGNTALVYETVCKKTRDRKALKVISRENALGKEELIQSEIAIMQRISHEFIVQMHECWQFDGCYYLSLELIPGGDLFEHLCRVRRVDERCAASLIRCLSSALDYLHALNIVHRDVKPENLLIYVCPYTGDLQLKLADFGLAVEMIGEPLTVICGTPTYVAPEVLAELGYDQKVDMWAAGVILYVLLCGFPPFQSIDGNQEQLFEQILSGRFSFPASIWNKVSYSAKGLIQGLLQLDVEERFSAAQILEYPWVQGMGTVSEEYERLMEAAIKASAHHDAQRDILDESEVEYFFSRRTSMDELSECHDGDYGASRRNSSFDFFTSG
uniref:Doublecortin-like and CAM kinase-like protein n=1 Tax=Ascaris suum TaxID=6253 RepID=F1KWN8_ASCSU